MTAFKNVTWWVGLAMLAVGAGFVAVAAQWEIDRRLYPWVIGVPVIALTVLHSVLGMIRGITAEVEEIEAYGGENLLVVRLKLFAWVIGLLTLSSLVGHQIGMPVFLFAFMVWYREKVWLAAAVAFSMWLFLYGLLDQIMHIVFPRPYLAIWFGL